jgi:hypothetical protein
MLAATQHQLCCSNRNKLDKVKYLAGGLKFDL